MTPGCPPAARCWFFPFLRLSLSLVTLFCDMCGPEKDPLASARSVVVFIALFTNVFAPVAGFEQRWSPIQVLTLPDVA